MITIRATATQNIQREEGEECKTFISIKDILTATRKINVQYYIYHLACILT